jgi:hypothetical protein
VSVILVAVAAAAYGAYVAHGGFYLDDWSNASDYQLARHPRYWSAVGDLHRTLGGRPVTALLVPIPHALFGVHPRLHLGLAAALGVVTSLSFYVLLRALSIPAVHACAIAVLALLFPWSDSVRLWAATSINSLSVCFFALGLATALHSLDRRGRAAVFMHAAAVALFVLSVFTYEVAAAAIILAGVLYLPRTSRRRALQYWAADVLAVLAALVYSLTATIGTRDVSSIGDRIHDARVFAREAVLLMSAAVVPVGRADARGKGLAIALGVAAVLLFALTRLRRERNARLRLWLQAFAVAAVAIAAADFMLLGSRLHPLDPGLGNRINVFAALPYCVLAYSVVALVVLLVTRGRAPDGALAVVAVALLAAGYGVKLARDESHWRRAASIQRGVLASIASDRVRLVDGDAVFSFGAPGDAAPGIPVFDRSWDLSGALRLQTGDRNVNGYPVFRGVSTRCASATVDVTGPGSYGTIRVPYRQAIFVDVQTGRVARVTSRPKCERSIRTFAPGPAFATT